MFVITTRMYPPSGSPGCEDPSHDLYFAPTLHGWRVSVCPIGSETPLCFIDLGARECHNLAALLSTAKGI